MLFGENCWLSSTLKPTTACRPSMVLSCAPDVHCGLVSGRHAVAVAAAHAVLARPCS
jgi:hypothetical protein